MHPLSNLFVYLFAYVPFSSNSCATINGRANWLHDVWVAGSWVIRSVGGIRRGSRGARSFCRKNEEETES